MTEQEILSIKSREETALLEIPGVQGVGLGAKYAAGVNTGTLAIHVFVRKKQALEDVAPAERIPTEVGGIPTDVIEMPESPKPLLGDSKPETDTKEYRPLQGGSRLTVVTQTQGCHAYGQTGTMACAVRRTGEPDGTFYALTNQHVVNGRLDDKVYQPGKSRSACCGHYCCAGTPVGEVTEAVQDDYIDAAIVKIGKFEYKNYILDIGPIAGTYDITSNDAVNETPVKKHGARTGLTEGTVLSVQAQTLSSTPNKGQILIKRKSGTEKFADEGDSGSALIYTDKEGKNYVAGLLWGGSSTNDKLGEKAGSGNASPISDVLSTLKIELVLKDIEDATVTGNEGPWTELLDENADKEVVRALRGHAPEVLSLINSRREVTVAWHRLNGPAVARAFVVATSDAARPSPTEFEGRPLRDSIERFEAVLLRHASPELRTDILRWRETIYSWIGKSLQDMIASASTDPVVGLVPTMFAAPMPS